MGEEDGVLEKVERCKGRWEDGGVMVGRIESC